MSSRGLCGCLVLGCWGGWELGRVISTSLQPVVQAASSGEWIEVKQRPGPRLTHETRIEETVSEEKNNSDSGWCFLCFSEALKCPSGVHSWAEMRVTYVHVIDVL